MIYDSRTDKPRPAVLYLTPVSTAGGVAITAGSLIAVLILHQTNNYNSDSFQFIWNIYANNDVVVPSGGCDVSARDVTVTLPTTRDRWPCRSPSTARKASSWVLPLRHHRGRANAIFTASASPAQGIGVQLTRNGSVGRTARSRCTVGTSPVNLSLTATYARTTGGLPPATWSIIGITFVYQ